MFALGLVAGLVAAVVFGIAAVVQAHAVRRGGVRPDGLSGFVLAGARDPLTLLVVVAYLVGFVLHAVAVWLLPLYLAQATIAWSLPVTALASRRVGESPAPRQWIALAAITVGLVLLALGAGAAGEVRTGWDFAVAVWLGMGLLLLAGVMARGRAGAALGTLAGLGYAGSAIAVRGVGLPLDAAVVVAALAVPAYGVVAFWLYSLGMHSSNVTSTTGPLIVAQTVVPAAIGVLLLGDGVRDGWAAGVVAGLVLATVGAVGLAEWSAAAADEPV